MTTAWNNPLLTLPQLAEMTSISVNTLRMWTDEAHDPLPTMAHGKEKRVLYSAFCEWYEGRYGLGGDLRGQETYRRKGRRKAANPRQIEGV